MEAVVALMTRKLVDQVRAPLHEELRRPRPRPDRGIGDRVFVEQRIFLAEGEPLDQREVRPTAQGARSADQVVFPVEADGVDHQRVTLPVATRVAHPLPYRGTDVRPPVQRDDACVVVLSAKSTT